MSLHFTDLHDDGTHRKRLLKSHAKAGGCIKLWPDESVTLGLGIAEGVETALTLAHGYQPVWAAIDSANLATLPVVGGIESLVIAEDGDKAGKDACEELARRWSLAEREIAIIKSPANADLNDVVMEAAA
jgi:phage/plasmid primase-like uncharacterized protein